MNVKYYKIHTSAGYCNTHSPHKLLKVRNALLGKNVLAMPMKFALEIHIFSFDQCIQKITYLGTSPNSVAKDTVVVYAVRPQTTPEYPAALNEHAAKGLVP